MYLSKETIDFFQFIIIGMLLALVFDFFRAYRKYKKTGKNIVAVQDIIYFVITGIILIFAILKLLDGNVRFHIFLALVIGIMIYVSTVSKYMIKVYIKMLKTMHIFVNFILLPITLFLTIFKKIGKIFNKNLKKCCNMLHNVILNICVFFKKMIKSIKKIDIKKVKIVRKQKRVTNEKIS